MKNILKLSFYSLVTAFMLLLSACDDNSELFTVDSSPTAAILTELNITNIELDPVNINNPAATFTWSDADYGQQAAVVYSLQFSMDDAFTNPYTATTVVGRTNVTLSVSEMNSAAGNAGLNPFEWSTLYTRVVSSLGTLNSATANSNVINFQVYPYFNYTFNDYYLVGDGTAPNWNNNSNNPALYRDPNNSDVFNYTGRFVPGHFKLLEVKGQWQPQWGTNDGSTIDVNPGGGSDPERFPTAGGAGITAEGMYSFTINFSTNTYTFEAYSGSPVASPTTLELSGTGVASPVSMNQLGFDSNIWYANGVRITPGEVSFLANGSAAWGATTSFSGTATAGGGNIPVIVEDDYDVWFNALTGQYILIPLNL